MSNANKLYSLTAAVCRFCQESGIGWTLENPASSLFWATSSVAQLGRDLSACLHTCVFDSCCWGGNRKKRTALWSSLSCVQELSQLCHPGLGHTHSAWGRLPDGSWSTSAEAAYPMPCSFWAAMIGKEYSLRLPAARVDSAVNWTPATGLYRARAGLGLFPRGRSPTGVTNPFSERLKIRVPLTTPATLLVPGSAAVLPGAPKGCKVLSVDREAEAWLLGIGVPCAPEAFLSHAAAVAHPSEVQPQLPVDLEFTVHCLETCTTADIASKRCQFLHSVLQRASELAPQESALHSRLAPHCQRVLAGKRLLLLKELLKGLGHEDVSLVDDISSGFRLMGWLPLSHVMEPKITAPSESAADLWRRRRDINLSIWRQTQPGKDPDVDSALWQATLDDAEAGWALLLPQCDSPPDTVLLSRRFPVVQASGIRAIDDFSFNGLNSTLGTCEKVLTMSTVHTVSLALRLLRSAVTRGLKLLGRCFDLKKAYRQLPIHLDDLPYAAVFVWSPDDLCPRVLQMFSLPFGASGSVPGFVRVAVALWRILCRLALVPSTLFFDDFTSITYASDASSAEATVHLLFRILGWRLALTGDKAQSYSELFQSLGVIFCLHPGVDSAVTVSNTESRRMEVSAWCLSKLREDSATPKECEQFASRIRWLAGQVFGRSSAAALRTLLRAGRESRPYSPRPLSTELRVAIRWLLGSIPKASPRMWSLERKRKLHLFTDGAFEGGKASIGAVLCDSRCTPLAWFGGLVPDSVTSDWFSDGTEHPIIQAELAAVVAAFHVWKQVLLGTNVLLWIDNEVVRFGIINAYMHPPSAMALLSPLLALEESTKVSLWVCRVPSHSNPSDGPSRGTCPAFLTQARPEKVDVGEVLLSACGKVNC